MRDMTGAVGRAAEALRRGAEAMPQSFSWTDEIHTWANAAPVGVTPVVAETQVRPGDEVRIWDPAYATPEADDEDGYVDEDFYGRDGLIEADESEDHGPGVWRVRVGGATNVIHQNWLTRVVEEAAPRIRVGMTVRISDHPSSQRTPGHYVSPVFAGAIGTVLRPLTLGTWSVQIPYLGRTRSNNIHENYLTPIEVTPADVEF